MQLCHRYSAETTPACLQNKERETRNENERNGRYKKLVLQTVTVLRTEGLRTSCDGCNHLFNLKPPLVLEKSVTSTGILLSS